MVVEVGDKVVVWGAGTESAFAKEVEPVEVGDTVDVITLSDGTKIPLPRLELDLDDYVWILPEWDTPLFPIDAPISWGVLPLGAALFTITGVPDCTHLIDSDRSWDENDLSGYLLIPVTGVFGQSKIYLVITGNTETQYSVVINDGITEIVTYEDWVNYISVGYGGSYTLVKGNALSIVANWAMSIYIRLAVYLAGKGSVKFGWRYVSSVTHWDVAAALTIPGATVPSFSSMMVLATSKYTIAEMTALGINYGADTTINPSYPDYDDLTISVPLVVNGNLQVALVTPQRSYSKLELTELTFGPEMCYTEHIAVGDKYLIYNPDTKRLVFNDSGKLITATNWVDCAEGSEAEIFSDPVDFIWDGSGHVYLTQGKAIFSTIQWDDKLQVNVVHGETLVTSPMSLGERITVSGQTVSRGLFEITDYMTAGKNTITLTAKNYDGTKVGFVTPIYVKRSMTVVTL